MVGTVGWDYSDWVGEFYDPDLPEEWFLAYYATQLRSVLVPASYLLRPNQDFSHWIDDCDDAFRFVFEVAVELTGIESPSAVTTRVAGIVARLGALLPRIEALILTDFPRADAATASRVDRHVQLVREALPEELSLAVDLPRERTSRLTGDIGVCWRPDQHPDPPVATGFCSVLTGFKEPIEIRRIIEQMCFQSSACTGAGLYFEPGDAAFRSAENARLIADMLGV